MTRTCFMVVLLLAHVTQCLLASYIGDCSEGHPGTCVEEASLVQVLGAAQRHQIQRSHQAGGLSIAGGVDSNRKDPLKVIPLMFWPKFLENFTRKCFEPVLSSFDPIFPMPVADQINFPEAGIPFLGTTSYPGYQLPALNFALEALYDIIKFNISQQIEFLTRYTLPMVEQGVAFSAAIAVAFKEGTTTVSEVFETNTVAAEIAVGSHELLKGLPRRIPFIQGSPDRAWDTDTFAASYISNSLLATFLEQVPEGSPQDLVLDFSGDVAQGASTLQTLKARAVQLAPVVFLRARGFCSISSHGLVLTGVEVQLGEKKYKQFNSSSPAEQWSLAKQVLLSLSMFVQECFHTGMHLLAGTALIAAQRALPFDSLAHGAFEPSSIATALTVIEMAAVLHSDHNSAFTGQVWDCDIEKIHALTADIAGFYAESSLDDILGTASLGQVPEWWAGGASSFVDPISNFARAIATGVVREHEARSNGILEAFSLQLFEVANFKNAKEVLNHGGFADLYRNILFVCGVCHTEIYATREGLTPLLGQVNTVDFLPVLLGQEKTVNPIASVNQFLWNVLTFVTTLGYPDDAPQLGDGPFPGFDKAPELAAAVTEFQSDINASRQKIFEFFGADYGKKNFLPAYFYPRGAPKPYGYGLLATTYC
mmetsp:Transcript_139169/g.346912  ORF Transcript_139169/g.346912 Transcript_139169/m.346912 type:complete len:651 (-) Transcript_139169:129-2081(-)